MENEKTPSFMDKVKSGASAAGAKVKSVATSEQTQNTMKKVRNFYIVDLVVRLVKGKNFAALSYLVLNIALIMGVFALFGGVGGAFLGLLVYVVCVCATLSPVGEWILRWNNGAKEIKDPAVLERLMPLFQEVYGRARQMPAGANLNPKVKLYITDAYEPNAFAMGRSTVCVTTGLLYYSDAQIKAILAHEMGHLANHDTDLILLITVGNFLVSAMVTIFRGIIIILDLIFNLIGIFTGGSEGALMSLLSSVTSLLTLVFVNVLTWIWTKLGVLLVMKSSRNQEFAADHFAGQLGYAAPLLRFFESINEPQPQGKVSLLDRLRGDTDIFAVLTSSHPSTQKRIDALKQHFPQSLGQNR